MTLILLAISSALTLGVFQNCSQVNFTAPSNTVLSASIGTPPPSSLQTSYAWVSSGWTSCSATCGGGTQTQTVTCQRNDGAPVGDSFCTGSKPTSSQACNVGACVPNQWVVGGFGSCSASCGGGTQSQTVVCQDGNGNVIGDSNCTDPKPATSQSCNTQACVTYSWVGGGFGQCSATCGGGTQTQTIACQDNNGNSVASSFCSSPPPPSSQSCNTQACLTYNWVSSGWSTCSSSCGGGSQTRTFSCVDSNGTTVDNSLCTTPIPPTAQACNTQTCPAYNWVQGGWSACSVTSACNGVQTQTVTCVDVTTNTAVASNLCTTTMPPTSQSCVVNGCSMPTWHNEAAPVGNYLGDCFQVYGHNPIIGDYCPNDAGSSCSHRGGPNLYLNCY